MIVRSAPLARRRRRSVFLLGVSAATLAAGLGALPARAQTAAALLGGGARAPRPEAASTGQAPATRSPTMQAALARQQSSQARVTQIRAYASALRQVIARSGAGDGLTADGLDPVEAVRQAAAAGAAGDTGRANALLVSVSAANDSTGLNTWEGAGLPTQTVVDGRIVVTIDQKQERALLSWNSFNIGPNTTLQFNQKQNGVAKTDWVAVNRVTNGVNPSLILGNVKADGTVVMLNQAGIIFGAKSQINTHSLLASTLELGNGWLKDAQARVQPLSVAERNRAYLTAGLFGQGNGVLSRDPVTDPNGPGVLVSAQMRKVNDATVTYANAVEGDIVVDRGAQITAGTAGFVMVAAPRISLSGAIAAVDGQVSLQAGRIIPFQPSSGSNSDPDPNVRGYKLVTYQVEMPGDPSQYVPGPGDGSIHVDGVIRSQRGYLSLGTATFGSIAIDGYLEATTSVSRNGKIELLAGTVALGGGDDPSHAAGLAILPDLTGETVPQGSAAQPPAFESSQIVVGTTFRPASGASSLFDQVMAGSFRMGTNAMLYAPNADVRIGGASGDVAANGLFGVLSSRIDLLKGAVIDVSGLKDVQHEVADNIVAVTPVKRNELSDTPNYREVAVGDNFTLNGATLYLDTRISGVRDDGVAWVGSPLIQGGALASQIPASVSDLMTKGGTVRLSTAQIPLSDKSIAVADAPAIHIARDALIDVSGGWVHYAGGPVRTSRLLTDDGRIVDIANADPNDKFVGVVDGLTTVQPRFGVVRSYLTAASQSTRYEASYDEGRDAGVLSIATMAATMDGSVFGNAFAGAGQILAAVRPAQRSGIAGDARLLQRSKFDLPSGGGLSILSYGDMLVYRGIRGAAEADGSELLLRDTMLNDAGLAALSLTAAGSITFAGAQASSMAGRDVFSITAASDVRLAPGGSLAVTAGRAIRLDGAVSAPSGSIVAETQLTGVLGTSLAAIQSNGSAFRSGLYGDGSGDDIRIGGYAADPGDLRPFDLTVTGALSTAGLWVNDYLDRDGAFGSAFQDGGSIRLTSARKILPAVAAPLASGARAVDLSGSILVRGSLDVSAGGYVSAAGALRLGGKGGDVSLVNATTYASLLATWNNPEAPILDYPFDTYGPSIGTAPVPRSTVDVSSATITGFGFAGGGTFALTAPDISFGSETRAGSAHIDLNFLARTGFGTLSLTSNRSRTVDGLFANDLGAKSAFLETSRFVIGAGETLDLTQRVLPSILTVDQARDLRGLATGARLLDQPGMVPITPSALWDQRAAHLVLGGLTELDVMAGGAIIGAPQASITTEKLYNAGSIVLRGGAIRQRNDLAADVVATGLGVRDVGLGGRGLGAAFGGDAGMQSGFSANATNAAAVRDAQGQRLLTNAELVSLRGADRLVYFLGRLDADQGVVLAAGSQTDLSGIALSDPRARVVAGAPLRAGRLLDGGSIALAAGTLVGRTSPGVTVATDRGSMLLRDDRAAVDISGATAIFDQALAGGLYAPYREWSAAGSISALGGGTLGTTAILARGGVAEAEGGTLEWLRPVLGSATAGAADYLSADMITRSGFDTVVARGGLTLDGNFVLSLRKRFAVTSSDPLADPNAPDANITVRASQGTSAAVFAGAVQFASRNRLNTTAAVAPTRGTGDANVFFGGGAAGIDFTGGIRFDDSIGNLAFKTPGDIRFVGVADRTGLPALLNVYSGGIQAGNNLSFDAYRTYAATGAGNLQALLEGSTDAFATAAYTVLAGGTLTIGNSYVQAAVPTPLSAGSHLLLAGRDIVQNGYLAAPLGLLELGANWTNSVRFGAGSTTTVSGDGLTIPYGSTTDKNEYYFPTQRTPITAMPAGELRLAAGSIVQDTGATFIGRGGGDVVGYQFQPGVGGSRDVLDRINRDEFSANGFDPATGVGYQYADQRQVFALVPMSQANAKAGFDPVLSADYGAAGPVDLYGSGAGRIVILDAAPGFAGGEYLLLPAKYAAVIPGALRVVENSGTNAPILSQSTTLLDGSIVVGGRYGFAGNGISESTRHSFTVQSKDVFSKFSTIRPASGTANLVEAAARNGVARSRAPLDAARVVLSPLTELRIAGLFDTRPATGGQAGQFDITGSRIAIVAAGDAGILPAGTLRLTDAALNNLNAPSLLVGGRRSNASDGSTQLTLTAQSLAIGSGASLQGTELLLGVAGGGSTLSVADGATLTASGSLGAESSGDYKAAGGGSLLRVAVGGERLVDRGGSGSSTLQIGAATLRGDSIALDSSGTFAVADAATLAAARVAISGAAIRFDSAPAAAGAAGVIGAGLEAKLSGAQQLTIRSAGAIRFSAGAHRFNDLVLDSASIALTPNALPGDTLQLTAGVVTLRNKLAAADGCAVSGFCGTGAGLTIDAATIGFGAGAVRAAGFSGAITLTGRDGLYVDDKGSFGSGAAALRLGAPFLADRAVAADPRAQAIRPEYSFLTSGDFTLTAAGTNLAATPKGNATPGARIGIGADDARVATASIDGALVRATAGVIDIQSVGDIRLTGASLQTPGYLATFGDKDDPVTIAANGGTINLLSAAGDIRTDAATRLVVDSGAGMAGTLNLLASRGTVALAAALNAGASGSRTASLTLDSGTGGFDLAAFVARYGTLFGGDLALRTGSGDLALEAGQMLKAGNVALTADGGSVRIGGTIDTSGASLAGLSAADAAKARVNGGDIALWGADGVSLLAGARLDTHTNGYADTDSRVAHAGDVTIGIGRDTASLSIAAGAVIDAGARRTQAALAAGQPGARLVPETITDAATGARVTVYRYAEADAGGGVTLRAPVIGTGGDKVAVGLHGAIQGAETVQLEGFTRYDLDRLRASGLYSGMTAAADGTILLDFGADSSNSGGKFNPFTQDFQLADGSRSMVRFIRNFAISALDGSDLAGIRLRPGVELVAAGAIKTSSAWNLAAASFSDAQLQAAVAAGDLVRNAELSTASQTRYTVVAGREGALLDRHASFLYRVGGAARGEAPVVTLRAGGNLTVDRSISDGFFTFRDKSDPAYISFQLGGGDRAAPPALRLQCGTSGNCAAVASYQDYPGTTPPTNLGVITIALGTVVAPAAAGAAAPLAIAGNGAAAGGAGQDSLGFAELFPLLDGNVAMHASDVRLAGGAGAALSANPLQVDRGARAAVTVSGEYGYGITATRGTATFAGALQLAYVPTGGAAVRFALGDTFDQSGSTGGLNQISPDAYTQLNWGSTPGLGADARAAALAWFAGKSYRLVGTGPSSATGIIAPLADVVAFLQSFEPTFQAGLASRRSGYPTPQAPALTSYGVADKAYVRSYVRSGDGDIAVAAAGNVDLQGTAAAEYRQINGTLAGQPSFLGAGQFGAAALYTAGVRVARAPLSGRVTGSGAVLTLQPDSPYLADGVTNLAFVPSPTALTDTLAVLARGGGDVRLEAGMDVLARRDSWTDNAVAAANGKLPDTVGSATQLWRVGSVGTDTEAGLAARYFTSGVGALAGGDVHVRAGRDIVDLTIALDSGITTTLVGGSKTMLTLGSGDLSVRAGRDLLAGRFDIASGAATVAAGRDIAAWGTELARLSNDPANLRVRLSDATVRFSAGGSATLNSVSALGVQSGPIQDVTGDAATLTNAFLGANAAAAGFFSPSASMSLQANGAVQITESASGYPSAYGIQTQLWPDISANPIAYLQVLPPSLALTSLTDTVSLGNAATPQMLYPSVAGQLNLFSQRDITNLSLAMSDVDPGLLGGAWSISREIVPYRLPIVSPQTVDGELRYQHSQGLTHQNDGMPVRIYTNRDLVNAALFLPKQARVTAGGSITNLFFQGQHLAAADITRIRAGGDISGVVSAGLLPYVQSNNFILGGPGTLIVEAGGDIGPFMSSANVESRADGQLYSFGGGVRTVGNDLNPWLGAAGADVSVRFGMTQGADYAALRDTYLNPANFAKLDGDLFAQTSDAFGNPQPDRTRPVYLPKLATWLRDHAPDAFAEVFGAERFASDSALADAAYGKGAALYAAFVKVDPLRQQDFLINGLLFGEIAAVGVPTGPSYQQYVRGYRALQLLFPTRLGYTDNLAGYTIDPATITSDHPLGEPVRTLVNGQPAVATKVHTGDLDLRLATIQTARGGNVSILGPGGDLIAGSTIRTADQPNRRETGFSPFLSGSLLYAGQGVVRTYNSRAITSVPLGYEGILTLQGGSINAFTDGDVTLNQSRVFTQRGGNITLWSSNGDLAAGQGPKSASSFPPITVRLDNDGNAEVNSAGSVAGAGIGTFKAAPEDPAADVILIAPVGTVDAGDAGVRASGNVVVAAARVANADNFKAAGAITGVPAATSSVAVAPVVDPSRDIRALVRDASRAPEQREQRSIITVKILGPLSDGVCPPGGSSDDPDCAQ